MDIKISNGAITKRFKSLENENATLKQEIMCLQTQSKVWERRAKYLYDLLYDLYKSVPHVLKNGLNAEEIFYEIKENLTPNVLTSRGSQYNPNQEKIDFAIERLEKVKEKLLEELQNVTDLLDPLEYEDYHEFIGCGRGYKNSIEEIDNQIKQIKEMK